MPVGVQEKDWTADVRFIIMPNETQPIKHSLLYPEPIRMYHEFTRSDVSNEDIFEASYNDYICQFRTREELISSVYIYHVVFSGENNTKRDAIALLDIYTADKYRRKGFATDMVKRAVDEFVKTKGLENPLIIAYTKPELVTFTSGYVFFHKLGFRKCGLSNDGVVSYFTKLTQIEHLKEAHDLMNSLDSITEEYDSVVFFVDYDKFAKSEDVDVESLIEEGNLFKEKFLERQKNLCKRI